MRWSFLVLIISTVVAQADLPEPEVRVRLLRSVNEVSFESSDFKISAVGPFSEDLTFFKRLRVKSTPDGFKLKSGKKQAEGAWSKLLITSEHVRVNGTRLANTKRIELVPSSEGGMDVMADVPLETYLFGVLPNEMPSSWPIEALKAQAIASRSYVLNQMQSRRSGAFDVDSTIHDQVFKPGTLNEYADWAKKVRKALDATKQQVLLDPKGQIQRTYFHSDCGGSTETSFFVWRTREATSSVRDEACPLGPFGRWTYSISKEELEKKLGIQNLNRLRVASQTPSGRIGVILMRFGEDSEESFLAEKFRQKLGYNSLKSTLFQITRVGDRFEFKGRGYGHGVGLCQWGSRHLALKGVSSTEILHHYFPQSKIDGFDKAKTLVARRR